MIKLVDKNVKPGTINIFQTLKENKEWIWQRWEV